MMPRGLGRLCSDSRDRDERMPSTLFIAFVKSVELKLSEGMPLVLEILRER